MAEGGAVWKEVVLMTLREREWKDGKGFGLWVVQKIKDGKSYEVAVRGGMYRPDKVTGEKVLPKEGLTEADFKLLSPIYLSQVLPLLQIPKGTTVSEDATDEPIEKMPWG